MERAGGNDVPDYRRTSGTSARDRDHELAVLGMDHDVSEREVVQGDAGPLELDWLASSLCL